MFECVSLCVYLCVCNEYRNMYMRATIITMAKYYGNCFTTSIAFSLAQLQFRNHRVHV